MVAEWWLGINIEFYYFSFVFFYCIACKKERIKLKVSGSLCRLWLDLFHCWGRSTTGGFLPWDRLLCRWQRLQYLCGYWHFLLWRLFYFGFLFHSCGRFLLNFYLLGHFHRWLYLWFFFRFLIVFLLVYRPWADFQIFFIDPNDRITDLLSSF